jgi:gluconolactonase
MLLPPRFASKIQGGTASCPALFTVALCMACCVGCHTDIPPAEPSHSGEVTTAVESKPDAATATATGIGDGALAGGTSSTAAARMCPPGPFVSPLNGKLLATEILQTGPSFLDPSDKASHLYEGAVWLDGALYFSDFKLSDGFPSRILRYVPGGALSIAVQDSGSNGLGLDVTGRYLVAARHKTKSVTILSTDGTIVRDVATGYQGKRFNSPNDVAFRSDGNLYFTDPDFQSGGEQEIGSTNVYRVAPDGSVSVVDDGIKNPNGVSLSPDEKTLYVAGNLKQGYVKRYPVARDGSVSKGTIFLNRVSVPDGMAIDCGGNVYVTEHSNRRIRVVGADGVELGEIAGLEHNVTNAAFGGVDRKTLFITTAGALYQISLPVPGLPY